MHSIISPIIKQFLIKLLSITSDNIKYRMTTKTDNNLNMFLYFIFIRGLLTVSAGA